MSEAEISELIMMMGQQTMTGVAVFFSIVSAYVVGLYYFLHSAPMLLKLGAYLFFTLTIVFLGVVMASSFQQAIALRDAMIELGRVEALSPVGRLWAEQDGLSLGHLDAALRAVTLIGFLAVYAALTYLTFWHPWHQHKEA